MSYTNFPLSVRQRATEFSAAGLTPGEQVWRMVALLLYWVALIALPFLMFTAPMLARADQNFRVSLSDAEQAVAQTLEAENIAPKVRVSLQSQGMRMPLATYEREIKVYVQRLQLDKPRNKLEATLVFETDGNMLAPIQVTGRYEELHALPVLNRAVRNGQVIAEDDVIISHVLSNRIRKETVTDKSQLVGKTALRTISPNRMVRLDELASPSIMNKGQAVTIRYVAKGLEIRALGEVQDGGAVGDMIRVRNRDSNQIVQGIVQDAYTVAIFGAGSNPVQQIVQPATLPAAASLGTPALVKQAPAAPVQHAASNALPELPATIPNQEMVSVIEDNAVADAPQIALIDPIDVLENSHAK